MPGFGQTPGARYGGQFLVRGGALPELAPSSQWSGVAASGFAAAPVDPVRTTAKPACRLLVPPGQRFTGTMVVGVAAFANDGGTLIGGVDRVRFHYEGSTVDVVAPSFRNFKDSNGRPVAYYGHWAALQRRAGPVGEALLYVEAIPSDATMQSRVIGPFSFYPQATLHDREYTIDPQTPVTTANFHTFDAAVARVKTDVPLNPRITFKRAMSNVVMTFAGATYAPAGGYLTVEAEAPVTFGRTAIGTTATVDSDSNLRPRVTGLWLKGANITIDYAFVDSMFAEDGKNYVLDGVNLTNSRGANAFWRGGTYFNGRRVRGNPYFLECQISNLENSCVEASLARGVVLQNVSRDIFADCVCIVGTQVRVHSDSATNNNANALTVVYTGVEATATVARSGIADPNSTVYTFKWGANSRTFTTGKTPAIYAAGLTGDNGYTFAHLVTWINTVLVGLDAGWSATLNATSDVRASSGSLLGSKGLGFGDTSCKTTARQLVFNFDAHGDWFQQRFGTANENVIAYDNLAYNMQTQNIFASSSSTARDFIFCNNALSNDGSGLEQFVETTVFSQLGRSGFANVISHVVVAHCSMPNQLLTFRNDGAVFCTFDAYCLVANNALRGLTKAVATAGREIGATIRDNHIHVGQTPLAEAVGTTIGGNKDSLFGGFNTGNFTPAGALLTNLKPPVVSSDLNRATRTSTAPAGALASTH